jgi:Tol biopolymer transport system component
MKALTVLKLPITLIVIIVFILGGCNTKSKEHLQSQFSTEKAWQGIGADFGTGDISPDGQYFTDINWSTGDLDLVNLETGQINPLTGYGYDNGGYAWMSSFSNNGEKIAFEWYNYDTGTHELRLYSMASEEVETLIPADPVVYYVEPLDWTNLNESILIAKNSEGDNWELGIVSVLNGDYKPIIELNWNAPGGKHPFAYPHAKFSPDDSFIGFDYRLDSSQSNDLYIVSASTGQLSVLWDGDGDDKFLYWSEDGSEVFFYSDRSGIPSIWRLAVNNGIATDDPILVKENLPGLTPIGYTRKGFAYGTSSGNFNTYLTTLNVNNGMILQKPKQVDSNCYCRNNVGTWSEDGDSLMFVRFKDMPSSRESVVIKSVINNGTREIQFPWAFHNKTGTVAWPSKNIVIVDGNSPGYSGLHLFNLKTREISIPFNLGEKGFFQRFKTNSDGSKFYIEMRWGEPGIVSIEPGTNKKVRLVDGPVVPSSTCISPDDRYLAFLRQNNSTGKTNIEILDLETKKLRVLVSHDRGVLKNPLVWTADGRRLIVAVNDPDNNNGLWSIDVKNPQEPSFINIPEIVNQTLVVSSNGQNFAYQAGNGIDDLYFAVIR